MPLLMSAFTPKADTRPQAQNVLRWVISGQTVPAQNSPLSALVQKQTNAGATALSAKCHKRTFALQGRFSNPPRPTLAKIL